MWTLKKIQLPLLTCAVALTLNLSVADLVFAEEVDELQETSYSILSSTSLGLLIYPLQNQPEDIDPMHDDTGETNHTPSLKKNNILFEQLIKFNDYFQNVTHVFNKTNTHVSTSSFEALETPEPDKKAVNCSAKNKPIEHK